MYSNLNSPAIRGQRNDAPLAQVQYSCRRPTEKCNAEALILFVIDHYFKVTTTYIYISAGTSDSHIHIDIHIHVFVCLFVDPRPVWSLQVARAQQVDG